MFHINVLNMNYVAMATSVLQTSVLEMFNVSGTNFRCFSHHQLIPTDCKMVRMFIEVLHLNLFFWMKLMSSFRQLSYLIFGNIFYLELILLFYLFFHRHPIQQLCVSFLWAFRR